jgi:hypothetical protein
MRSETSLDCQVGDQEDFGESGTEVAGAEYGLHIAVSHGTKIALEIGLAVENRYGGRGKICGHAYPSDAGHSFADRDGLAHLVGVEHMAEIDASFCAETVIAPGAGVDVQQLV